MALINCPDCNKQVSDKAPTCNGCGCPINPNQLTSNENNSSTCVSTTTPSEIFDDTDSSHQPYDSPQLNKKKKFFIPFSIVGFFVLFLLVVGLIDSISLFTGMLMFFSILGIACSLIMFIIFLALKRKKKLPLIILISSFASFIISMVLTVTVYEMPEKPPESGPMIDANTELVLDLTPTPTPFQTPSPTPVPETSNHNLTQSRVFPSSEMVTLASLAFADGENIIFYNTPDIIFTTTAAENELDGTFMYIQGTLQTFDVADNEFPFILVQTDKGMIALGLPMDLFDLGIEDGLLTTPTDVDFLKEGQEYGFFYRYQGFSMVLEMPSGLFVGIDRENLPDVELTFEDTFIFDGNKFTFYNEIEWIVLSDDLSIFRIPLSITNTLDQRRTPEVWDDIFQYSPNGIESRVGSGSFVRHQFDFTTEWELNFMKYDLCHTYLPFIEFNETVHTYMHFPYDIEDNYTIKITSRKNTIDDVKVTLPIPEAPTRATNTPTPPPRGINAETYSHLKTGMSISQVRTIMGIEPSSESTSMYEILGTRTYSTILDWSRFNPYRSITVGFSGSTESGQTVSSLFSTNLD